jgi:hypothetical protein
LDHPFENLGPERFQQLCQALFVKEFPGVVCLPVGQPDGGRDAIQRISTGDGEEFIVFQVKFSRSVQAEVSEREWVMAAARGEAAKVRRLKEKGACKYVFVTNVRGTAHLEVGSIDRLQVELAQAVGIPVQCWWRDDISRRIDSAWDLKLRYPELLTGQDFLRLLVTHADPERHERRWNAISNFIGEQYRLDQDVKFKQVELQNKLLDLFVDLPFHLSLHELAGQMMRPLTRTANSVRLVSCFAMRRLTGFRNLSSRVRRVRASLPSRSMSARCIEFVF